MTAPIAPQQRLEIREIAAIAVVAQTRSFKIAAGLIHTTQPTLSRLIASAEAKLGVALFRRGWSGAETTPRGDAAVRVCVAVLAEIERAERRLFPERPTGPALAVNLRNIHLEAIEAVTRDGSVTLAARRLGRSQPELSRTLSDFSKRFRINLFRRTASGMEPLPSAALLTELSGTVAHRIGSLRQELRRFEGEMVGRVSIGMLPFSGQELIARAFAQLTNQHPHVRLACIPGSYNGLIEALRRRELDRVVGILRGPDCPPGLQETPLYDEHFAVVARRGHPLAGRRVDPQDLARTQWVVAPHGTPVRAHFETVFAAIGLAPPTQSCEMLSFTAAEQMIIESNSVAMLTYSPRKLQDLRPELCLIETPFPDTAAPVGLTRLGDVDSDAPVLAFEQHLRALALGGA